MVFVLKKFISIILMTILLCSLLCACQTQKPNVSLPTNSEEKYTILFAEHMNYGESNKMEDYWSGSTYTLETDGTLKYEEHYNLSGSKVVSSKLNADTLNEVVSILNAMKNMKDDNSAEDGSAWNFSYYDKNGKEIENYNGYIYNNKKLQELVKILEGSTDNGEIVIEKGQLFFNLQTFYKIKGTEVDELGHISDRYVEEQILVQYDGKVCYIMDDNKQDSATVIQKEISKEQIEKLEELISKIEKVEVIDDDYMANWTLVSYLKNGDSNKYLENLNCYNEETEKLLQYLDGIIHEVVPTT